MKRLRANNGLMFIALKIMKFLIMDVYGIKQQNNC